MTGYCRVIFPGPPVRSNGSGSVQRRSGACLAVLMLLTCFGTGVAQEPDIHVTVGELKLPIPSAARQAEIVKILDDTFVLSKADTQTKKQEVVKKLMTSASGGELLPDEQYVVLTAVARLATETGDFVLFWDVVGRLGKSFDGAIEQQHLTEFLERCKVNSALKPAAEEAVRLAKSAAAGNQFQAAVSLLNAADAAVQRARIVALTKSIVEVRKSVSDRETQWKAFDKATIALSVDSSDRSANTTVGRWHALKEGRWDAALPYLAKGNDATWASVAEQDLLAPRDAAAHVALGDAWWDIGQSDSGEAKTPLLLRAGHWYGQALPHLTSLQKQRIAKRLREIEPLRPVVPVTSTKDHDGPVKVTVPAPSIRPVTEERVDLLQWADGLDWSPRGFNWNQYLEGKPMPDGLRFKPVSFARFPLPAIIDGDYVLNVEFTRFDGDQSVGIFFPLGDRTLHLELGAQKGASGGVNLIDGKTAIAGNATTRRPCAFENNRRQKIQIHVLRDGDLAAFIIDWNDTQDYIKWEGKYAALSDPGPPWGTTLIRHPWIGSYENDLVFHKVDVRMLSGTIHRDTITDSDRQRDQTSGYVRLVGERPREVSVGWGQFGVSQMPLEMAGADVERGWPLISRDFRFCGDFYGAHPPSRIKCSIPPSARSFTAIGYNESTKTVKYQALIDGKEVYDSGERGMVIVRLKIPPGASSLELVTDPMGNFAYDFTYWCYPRFHSLPLEKVTDGMLDNPSVPSGFSIASGAVGFGTLTHNQPIELQTSAPVRFRDALPCHEFLYCHAPSTLTYDVPSGMSRFTAIGYKVFFHHHVKFEVWADGTRIYQSPQAGIVAIDVKLPPGTRVLQLQVDDLGGRSGDHSMWCFPRLHQN